MIVCPVGFVADHIEVVWDLDNELAEQAAEAGIAFARASTPNAQPRFAELVVDLIDELRLGRAAVDGSVARTGAGLRQQRQRRAVHTGLRGLTVLAAARPSAGSRSTAASRAERTTAVSGRSASLASWTSDELCSPIGISPELTVMIASTWAAFSSTRTARVGAWSGMRCSRVESSTCSTSRRGSATSPTGGAGAQRAQRVGGRAHRVAKLILGLAEVEVSRRPGPT